MGINATLSGKTLAATLFDIDTIKAQMIDVNEPIIPVIPTITITGTPPLTFNSLDGSALSNWRVYGGTGQRNIFFGGFYQGAPYVINNVNYIGASDRITSAYWFPIISGKTYTVGIGDYANFRFAFITQQTKNHFINFSQPTSYCGNAGSTGMNEQDYIFTATNSGYGMITLFKGDSGTITPSDVSDLGVYVKTDGAVGDDTANICTFPGVGRSTTEGNVTFTVNSDMTVSVSGTASAGANTFNNSSFYFLMKGSSQNDQLTSAYYGKWRMNVEFMGEGSVRVLIPVTVNGVVNYYGFNSENGGYYYRWNSGEGNVVIDKCIFEIEYNINQKSHVYLTVDEGKTVNGTLRISITPELENADTEPYGMCRIPVTLGGVTRKAYVSTELTVTNDTPDYIDFATQKRYNADGTTEDVTLPALTPTVGSNTMSVGTSVQPERVSVTGKINNQ